MKLTKEDIHAVLEAFRRDEQRRLGPPPTTEEMFAYIKGELSAEQAEGVRERLMPYPELRRILVEPFPEDAAKPGELGYISPEELEARWLRLRDEIARAERRRAFKRSAVRIARTAIPLFAGAAVMLIYCWMRDQGRPVLSAPLGRLYAHGIPPGPLVYRGRASDGYYPLWDHGHDAWLLVLGDDHQTDFFCEYRLVISTAEKTPRRNDVVIEGVRDGWGDQYVVVVPKEILSPVGEEVGYYRLKLYGARRTIANGQVVRPPGAPLAGPVMVAEYYVKVPSTDGQPLPCSHS